MDHTSQLDLSINKKPKHGCGGEKKEQKGYMALRNNVWEVREQLWHELLPFEMQLLDAIISKTIKWRTDEAKITIQELMDYTRKDRTWVYRGLKKLQSKNVIVRRKHQHNLIIGLNPDFFGGLLIKRHEDALQKRRSRIKVVVDNSKNKCVASTNLVSPSLQTSVPQTTNKCVASTEIDIQITEIIEQSAILKTFFKDILLKTSLKESQPLAENKQSFTLSGGTEAEEAAKAKAYIRSLTEGMLARVPR